MHLQKLDRELEQALATLQKEQDTALGDVNSKVCFDLARICHHLGFFELNSDQC